MEPSSPPPGARGDALRRGPRPRATTAAPPRPALGRAAVALVRALGSCPLETVHRLGAAAGWLLHALPTEARRVTDVNLGIAYPDLDPARRRALARDSLVETGRTIAEIAAWWTWDLGAIERRIADVQGGDRLDRARAAGRGTLLILPHLGSWELMGPWVSSRHPLTALYRAPRVRELDGFFRACRERMGARLVPADMRSARALLASLRDGGVVAILPDQDAGEGAGAFVPFFGELANTMTLLPKLAHRSGADLTLGWAERRPVDRRHVLHFRAASPEIADADPAVGAAALNRDIERAVRTCPEQYLWSYRRFRVRPRGEPNPYRRR